MENLNCGLSKNLKEKFIIYLINDKLFSNSQKAFSLAESKKIGEKKEGKIIYLDVEALFLIEEKKAILLKNNKILSYEKAINLFSKKNKNFLLRFLVYKELRKKGYIVKTGAKFGGEFRVYKKDLTHSSWICIPLKETTKINLYDIISKIRVAHSSGKKLLIAVLDSEEDLFFYEIDWVKI